MNDHFHYEELAALAAGGHLTDKELAELQAHMVGCEECRKTKQDFSDLVRSGLPLLRSHKLTLRAWMKNQPEAGALDRFIERAQREGVRFSNARDFRPFKWLHSGLLQAGAAGLALLMIAGSLYVAYVPRHATSARKIQAQQLVSDLEQQVSELNVRLAGSDQMLTAQQHEIQELRSQLGKAAKQEEINRLTNEQNAVRIDQSTSQTAQLANDLQNREKELTDAKEQIERINALHANGTASLVAQQIQINEISDKLRIASATLDMERQVAASGSDIRELMVARQLHVVDVRDTDESGKPSPAFARVFLTEGKSLVFYAFDLNEEKMANSRARFQLWGERLGKQNSTRSLGVLYADNKTQNRWALKLENPKVLSEIDSVFVTVSRHGDDKPSGQRLLYAYLGHANHP